MNELKPNLSIVVAITDTHAAVGNGGKLVVYISDDLKRFKAITLGHAIIMGRKTYESIGRALPGRTNFVVTRNPDFKQEGVVVCNSFDEAIQKAWAIELKNQQNTKEIFVIGGGELYAQALPLVSKLYLTLVRSDLSGDVFFPDYSDFTKISFREDRVDQATGLSYTWIDLER